MVMMVVMMMVMVAHITASASVSTLKQLLNLQPSGNISNAAKILVLNRR